MNAACPLTFVPVATATVRVPHPSIAPLPPLRRERDFGVGYGRSRGYASPRRYASDWAPLRFRFI